MKKKLALVLTLMLAVVWLAACDGGTAGIPTSGEYTLNSAQRVIAAENSEGAWAVSSLTPPQSITATGKAVFDGDQLKLTLNDETATYTIISPTEYVKQNSDFFKTGLDAKVFSTKPNVDEEHTFASDYGIIYLSKTFVNGSMTDCFNILLHFSDDDAGTVYSSYSFAL